MFRYIFLFIWLMTNCSTPENRTRDSRERDEAQCSRLCDPNANYAVSYRANGFFDHCICYYQENSCEVPNE